MIEETEAAYKLKPYRCFHCKTRIVVMNTSTGSVLPVEVPDGAVPYDDDEEFDYKKHTSHLLKCEKLRLEWDKKKWKFIKQRNPLAMLGSMMK